jgi:hypothetical protein
VGKSSLVNMVVGRRAMAYTSKTPGKTQQFNYFNVSMFKGTFLGATFSLTAPLSPASSQLQSVHTTTFFTSSAYDIVCTFFR